MALPSTLVWEIRTTGAANNGGGFNSARGGTDYTQQNAAQASFTTELTTPAGGSTTLNSVSALFTADMVGNVIRIHFGVNFTLGYYEIVTFNSSTSVVLDRTPSPGGAGASGSGNVGGATTNLDNVLNGSTSAVVAGNTVWLRAGTYARTTALTLPENRATARNKIKIFGYTTTRGDAVAPVAVLDLGSNSVTGVAVGAANADGNYVISCLAVKDGGGSNDGFDIRGRNTTLFKCSAENVGNAAFRTRVEGITFIQCEAKDWGRSGNQRAGFQLGLSSIADTCIAYVGAASVNSADGYEIGATSRAINCIARRCSIGFRLIGADDDEQTVVRSCCAIDCSSHGFQITSTSVTTTHVIADCMAVDNGGYGIEDSATSSGVVIQLLKFYHYNNTSGALDAGGPSEYIYMSTGAQSGDVVQLNRSPFVDKANGDFRLRPDVTGNGGEQVLGNGLSRYIIYGRALTTLGAPDAGPSQRARHRRRT